MLVPEKKTDNSISQEFENIQKWTIDNKMIINLSKTKDIVFCRPNPYQFLQLNPVDDIEQVREAKVLDVILNHKLHFECHVQFILRQCSRRMYLLELFHKQELLPKQLNIVY